MRGFFGPLVPDFVKYAGDYGGEEIPVPIPNTEVKLPCADDSAVKCESKQLPVFFEYYIPADTAGIFFLREMMQFSSGDIRRIGVASEASSGAHWRGRMEPGGGTTESRDWQRVFCFVKK